MSTTPDPAMPDPHDSDCSLHSGPAYQPGPCDCSITLPVRAWLHAVKQRSDDEPDEALSFAPDNFPLQGMFYSVSHAALVLQRDAQAALAALQARLDEAEGLLAELAALKQYEVPNRRTAVTLNVPVELAARLNLAASKKESRNAG